jgi:phytoene dehydrogenase-like protein
MKMGDTLYDTIIVGAGIAGLTAAAYLSRAGKKVLLLEKNETCGGLVNSFTHNGFVFDAGVRALEDAGIILPMMKDLGIEMKLVKSPVSVGVEDRILNIENLESLDAYRYLLTELYPESGKEIESLLKIIRKVMRNMDVLYGIENPLFKDLKHDWKFLLTKIMPWFPKFIFTVGKINRMSGPVEEYLDTIIKNRSLRDIISQHFFKNTPTFFALSYFSLYLDYFYPKGGVGKISEALEQKVLELGGEIRKGVTITEIDAGSSVAIDNTDSRYRYNSLIWAADLKTFYRLVKSGPGSLSPETLADFEKTKENMLDHRGGDSVFSLFLEIDAPPESFGNIAHGHFFYTPSREGLAEIHRKELNYIIENFDSLTKQDLFQWLSAFIKYNTYEISIPALKDPDLAPEGKTGLIISFLAEYDLFRKIKDAGWYEEFNQEIEEQVRELIGDSLYPMLKDRILHSFSFSPISIEERTGSSEGAITGWSFERPVPVVHKIQFSDRSVLTPFPSIFQAGQWAYSPAGVPMSILTGKMAADRVVKQKPGSVQAPR